MTTLGMIALLCVAFIFGAVVGALLILMNIHSEEDLPENYDIGYQDGFEDGFDEGRKEKK